MKRFPNTANKQALIEQVRAAFVRDGLQADIHDAAVLEIGKDALVQPYRIAVERRFSAESVGALVSGLRQQRLQTAHPVLLLADYISAPAAERLRAAGQEYADAAGNAWLCSGPFFILKTGNRLVSRPAADLVAELAPGVAAPLARYDAPGRRAVTPAGIKLLFALMCQPALAQATYRELAAAAGVALGALTQTLEDLQQHGYLTLTGRTRRLLASRRLLDDWALMYARTLRPKYLLRTLTAAETAGWQAWSIAEDAAMWGGEAAAHLRVGFLRPGVLTVYAPKLPARLMIDRGLKAAAPGATERLVEIRQIFWGAALLGGRTEQTVPAPLIYADLLATGDARCIETAQKLYEQELAGFFPSA